MKKLLLIAISLFLVMSLLSCGADLGDATDALTTEEITTEALESTEAAEETTEGATEEPVTEAEDTYPGASDPLLAKIAQHIAESDNYLIFSIGDSLTEGQGATVYAEFDYTAMFTKKLGEVFSSKSVYRVDGKRNATSTGIDYPDTAVTIQEGSGNGAITVARCGIGGNTVKRIINRSSDFIGKEIQGQTGNLFIISSGINDSFNGDKEKYATPLQYKQNLNTLIDMIYATHPDADIILMTPTYVHNNNLDYGKSLNSYANYMKAVASDRNIACIDLHALWMNHYVEGAINFGQGDWLNSNTTDSCHPSNVGHEAIATEMIRCLFGIN